MYKLDLETLTEERLRRAVDEETYRLGLDLFTREQIQVIEVNDVSAHLVVPDKRKYHVEIKVGRDQLLLKCGCAHGNRALICEHEVAAWLELRRHLVRRLPAPWQVQLSQVLNSAASMPRRSKSPGYFLFFSLHEDQHGMVYFWRISPFTLAYNALPAEIRKAEPDAGFDSDVLLGLVETHPELRRSLKTPYYSLDPEGCLNSSREAVDLANIILERNRAYAYSYSASFPLDNFLVLLRRSGAPVILGEPSSSLARPLQIHPRRLELQLNLERENQDLHISLVLCEPDSLSETQDKPLRIKFEQIQEMEIVLQQPLWLLIGSRLIELANPEDLSLFDFFFDTPELVIPADQVESFADEYLGELARRFPIQGGAIAREILQAQPTPRLYLNDNNGELQAQLRFGYEDLEVRYDPDFPLQTIRQRPGGLTLVEIERDVEAERQAYTALSSATYGLKRAPLPSTPGLFRLRARVHPVDFLLNMVPRLASAGFEVFGEEQLKTARVNRNAPTISFRVTSGIDWFDVQAVVSFGELEVRLKEIRRALRKRERYIKLADGSIGEIPEEWIERYKHLFSIGESEGDNLRFSRHHISLIEQALSEDDFAHADAEFIHRRDRLRALTERDFEGITTRRLPDGFNGELRQYQKAGYDWLHFLHEFEFGGCLADDMGLGKTIQTLVFLQSLYGGSEENRPPTATLLVVPRSLLVNWQREAERFTPELRILEFFDTDRVRDISMFDNVDLVITTYGVLLRDIQLLHGYTFHYAILDESQAIKNPISQTARAAHLIRTRHRLVLTGTPIENSTAELWSQFAFLNPGLLGSLQYFKTEFGLPIEKKNDEKAADSLRKLVYPFILRRTKDQVAPELPPRTERILFCDMEPAQRKHYNRMRDYYRSMVLGMLDTEGLNASRMKILEGLLRLRQICNHPVLADERYHGGSAKFELLLDTLETLQAEKHKALVFSQFVKMLGLVRGEMDRRGMTYTYLDGQTTARQEQVDRFQGDASIPFFLISLRAGGLGLNLTAADYVIHIDPWWNPAVEMQASDRTHRIGQDKPVFIYKLIARDSVEEKILLLQDRKRSLVDQIITTEKAFFKSLTREDVEELFSNGQR